ncbi:S8 family serine peptidase, partial [Thermus scotoductus]|uniref:S8 family serine peptidase n=1 Tax=Thermus scotoductus TaxID=37636 RepID=UPI0010022A5C
TTTSSNTITVPSMASPHVAGAAALVLSPYPSYTPAQVKQALLQNAESTVTWQNTSGNPHPEPFLNVRGF